MRKKRAITLLEIMIVILLIGLIGGVVSYNLKGTLEKGKAFASKEGAQKLEDIINIELQQTSTITAANLVNDKTKIRQFVLNSGLISERQIDKFLKDGWNEEYEITLVDGKNEVAVSSAKQKAYEAAR